MKVLSQIVDTLKLHNYFKPLITAKEHYDYAKLVDDLKQLKDEAMAIHHSNNEMRFVNYRLGSDEFRVMATTRSGFQVTIKNQDIEISLKAPSFAPPKHDRDGNIDKKIANHTSNPFAKVEFRASFLARVGHVSAVQYVNELFEKWILKEYDIKVSEIHLACDIQGYNFTELDFYKMQTRKKRNDKHHEQENVSNGTYFNGRRFTGFDFGKGAEMLRIYDKTVEIQKNPEKAFVKTLIWENNPSFDKHEKVWRIEAQYRREKLKTIFAKGTFLEELDHVLNCIPEIWGRALKTFTFKDMDLSHCFEMTTKSEMTFDGENYVSYVGLDGKTNTVKASAITKRYQRAYNHPLWDLMSTWKGYVPEITEVHKAPKTSAFQWVYNQIKGLFTTLYRYSGELSPKAFVDAFTRTNDESKKKNSLNLVDSAVVNNIKYLDSRRTFVDVNGSLYPSDRILANNITEYLSKTILDLHDDDITEDRQQILFKYLEKMEVA